MKKVTIYKQVFVSTYVYFIWKAESVPLKNLAQVSNDFHRIYNNNPRWFRNAEWLEVPIKQSMDDWDHSKEMKVTDTVPLPPVVIFKILATSQQQLDDLKENKLSDIVEGGALIITGLQKEIKELKKENANLIVALKEVQKL